MLVSGWSFRVTLGPQPVYAARSLHPFIGVGFARKSLDVANFRAEIVRLNLPVTFRDAFVLEYDARGFARGFAHTAEYAPSAGLARL